MRIAHGRKSLPPTGTVVPTPPSSPLGAPVLTETSTAGTNPPTWDTVAADLHDGDTVELYYTEDGSTPTATGTPQGSIIYDARLETINWGTAWPNPFPDGVTVKWAERYGRVIGGSMVWSALSNVLSDTMPVVTTPDFVASSAQPAVVSAGGTNTVTFTGIDFQAGRYVVYVAPTSPLATAVTANGVPLTNVLSAVDSFSGICISPANQAATASCNVVVTLASTTANALGIMPGTLKNVSSATPSSTARSGVWAAYAPPVTTTSALTIPAGGVAVAFATLSAAIPHSANNGTQLSNTGMNNFTGRGVPNGVISKDLTSGAWTPSFDQNGTDFANVLAAAWAP